MRILVTGGCGFIGSNFVRYLRKHHPEDEIVILDALTYAGNLANLDGLVDDPEFLFRQQGRLTLRVGDITDRQFVEEQLIPNRHRDGKHVDAVVHLAASSHVDRSIHDAETFVRTNVLGTQLLLDAAVQGNVQKFVHVSSDEVYGDRQGLLWATELSLLRPSSPYAASKAAADELALAYHRTYRLDVSITRSTNNFGPFQFPEKLIPHAILRALAGEKIPIYGDGLQRRDWLHVEDHCEALDRVLRQGKAGEIYNIGSGHDMPNLSVVKRIIEFIGGGRIEYVDDRPGHDRCYAVDTTKMNELGWFPRHTAFVDGLRETITWYKANEAWWRPILSGEYRQWVEKNYGKRKVIK